MSNAIKTTSRIRMMYLKAFGGHRVRFTRRRPQGEALGMVLYRTTWVLTPAE